MSAGQLAAFRFPPDGIHIYMKGFAHQNLGSQPFSAPSSYLALNMTKADNPTPPTKVETFTLKVFIHCEGCRRKVKSIIRGLDGIESITIDSESGKVTVTGGVDAKAILQRLQKHGKQAEIWSSSNPAAGKGGNQQSQAKANSNNKNNGSASETATASKSNKKGGGGKGEPGKGEEGEGATNTPELEASAESNENTAKGGGGGGEGGGGKKGGGKKGGNSNNNGGGNGGGGAEAPSTSTSEMASDVVPGLNKSLVSNKSMAPQDYVQTGYSLQSAEYATHMFSDENANNCRIM